MKSKYQNRNSDTEWVEISSQWVEITARIERLKLQQQQLKEKLIALSENQNTVGGGVRLIRSIRKGTVDYSKIPELKNVDLDQYRKNPIETWILTSLPKKQY